MTGAIPYTAIVDGSEITGQVNTGLIDLYGELLSMYIRADVKKHYPNAKRIRITSL